jgi:signal transduction histidine kinase
VLAALLAVFAALDVLLSGDWRGPVAVNAVAVPALALTRAWRRRRPTAVLAVAMGGLALLSLAFESSQTWSSVFLIIVAVYSAAVYGSAPLAGGGLAACAIAVVTLRDPLIHSFGDAVWSSSLLGLTFLAGLAGRALQTRTGALDARAEALEREELARATAAAAEERRRIARELHDVISPSISVGAIQTQAVRRRLRDDQEREAQDLRDVEVTARQAMAELRRLFGILRASGDALELAPQPGLDQLEKLIERTRERGIDVQMEITGERRPLPPGVDLAAYRIVQEALTNVAKHAGPATVTVMVAYAPRMLELVIEDDGRGPIDAQRAGHGLAGMRERVSLSGGSLRTEARPGGGFRVAARLPLDGTDCA